AGAGKFATGFKAVGVTFRNTYVGRPAVAFQSLADETVLYKCNTEGFQDTLDVMGSGGVPISGAGKESTANKTSGFVFHNSKVRASPGLSPVPKQAYATVVFLKNHLDARWAPWSPAVKTIPNTVYFGEYLNYGSGADVSRRTVWPGLHLLTSYAEALWRPLQR
ncbi:hypothetical protein V2J09_015235, partial [Rumex salicifolius]